VYKYTPPVTTTPTSLGCYVDASSRLLSAYSTVASSMSSALCISICQGMGYKYAGTEYSTQCYCGNTFDKTKNIATSGCNMKCGGSTEMCGGGWRLNAYAIGTPTTTATSLQGWSLQGCYLDSFSRVLATQLSTSTPITPAICVAGALANGFTYAGLENGDECWMGNAITGDGSKSTACTLNCAGDQTQICG
jgi:glucan endo-1,3-alpha-glucosidase